MIRPYALCRTVAGELLDARDISTVARLLVMQTCRLPWWDRRPDHWGAAKIRVPYRRRAGAVSISGKQGKHKMVSESYPLTALLIQTIGAIATAAAAIAAWRAANESRSASREMRARRHEERQQNLFGASTAAFWSLTQRWDDLAITRIHAGQASQDLTFDEMTQSTAMDAVLDFLDCIAFLLKRQRWIARSWDGFSERPLCSGGVPRSPM
jgi:hypothetical protein